MTTVGPFTVEQLYGALWILAERIANEQFGEAANPQLYFDDAIGRYPQGLAVAKDSEIEPTFSFGPHLENLKEGNTLEFENVVYTIGRIARNMQGTRIILRLDRKFQPSKELIIRSSH